MCCGSGDQHEQLFRSGLARIEKEAKKKESKLEQDMNACEKDGYGAQYGQWKSTQPIQDVKKIIDTSGWKYCEYCGKFFKPKRDYARFCCPTCQQKAYSKTEKVKEKNRAYRERVRKRKEEEEQHQIDQCLNE